MRLVKKFREIIVQHTKLQLFPPHIHQRNAAERAINTFKDHSIAGLASTDQQFPLTLLGRVLKQA